MRKRKHIERRRDPKTFPTVGNAKIEEAAVFLNCSRSTVYAMIDDGRLKTIEVGTDKRIPWHVLWSYHDQPIAAEAGAG